MPQQERSHHHSQAYMNSSLNIYLSFLSLQFNNMSLVLRDSTCDGSYDSGHKGRDLAGVREDGALCDGRLHRLVGHHRQYPFPLREQQEGLVAGHSQHCIIGMNGF